MPTCPCCGARPTPSSGKPCLSCMDIQIATNSIDPHRYRDSYAVAASVSQHSAGACKSGVTPLSGMRGTYVNS